MALNLQLPDALDTSTLLDDSTFSDCVVFSSDDKNFKLHRVILAHLSDCFKTMLTTDMIEGSTRIIQLSENSKILGNLFDLIYKRKCTGDVDDFMDLIITAKKYLIMDLSKKCHDTLLNAIDSTNAVKILTFAHQNDFKILEEKALLCAEKNFENIRKSFDWLLLMENPELLNMVVDSYIKHVNQEKKELKIEASKANRATVPPKILQPTLNDLRLPVMIPPPNYYYAMYTD